MQCDTKFAWQLLQGSLKLRTAHTPVGGSAKVEHGGDADHDTGWYGVDVEPEADERACHQHDARHENGANVERLVSRKHQQHA